MEAQKKIKALVFDMGGVLVRTDSRQSRTELAAQYGMTYEELEEIVYSCDTAALASVGKIPESAHWDEITRRFQLQPDELSSFKNRFWQGDQLNRELVDYIQSKRANYRTGILSNAWAGTRQTMQKRYRLLDYFDDAIFSAEVLMVKPDPAIYGLILGRLGVSAPEAVFVDDFIENIVAARALGMYAVHFRSNEQAIGEIEAILAV